jgi:hypothetical protein
MTEQENGSVVSPEQRAAMEFEMQRRAYAAGAGWFYWVAGLSVANSLVALFEGGFGFIFGLGVTRLVDEIGAAVSQEAGEGAAGVRLIALGVSVFVAGIFVLLGWLARQGRGWAFFVGIGLYFLDGLLLLLVQDWLSLVFHAFVLYGMFRGYQALSHLRHAAAGAPAP